ncbi:putative mitochondrial import inner membrane translocase subunit TIM22 [Helianthus anomalus]
MAPHEAVDAIVPAVNTRFHSMSKEEFEARLKQIQDSIPKPIVAAVTRFASMMEQELQARFKQIQNSIPKPILTFASMSKAEFEARLKQIRNSVRVPSFGSITEEEFDARYGQILNWIPEYVADGFIGALSGAVGGVVMSVGFGLFPKPDQETLSAYGRYQPLAHALFSGSGWQRARTFAVLFSVATSLYLAMLNIRGKDDLETRLVAAFGSGIAVSLATGLEGPEVISFGVLFALGNGGMFKVIMLYFL